MTATKDAFYALAGQVLRWEEIVMYSQHIKCSVILERSIYGLCICDHANVVHVVTYQRWECIYLSQCGTPWVVAAGGGVTVGEYHQFIQRIVQQAILVFPTVIFLQCSRYGYAFQCTATSKDAGFHFLYALRQDDGLKGCAVVEQVGGQHVAIGDVVPFAMYEGRHVQVMSLAF